MGRAALVSSLLALVGACEEPPAAATPEPFKAAATPAPAGAPSAPTVVALPKVEAASAQLPSTSTTSVTAAARPDAAPNGIHSAQLLDASKKSAPAPAGEMCRGAAQEGCVPKNDRFGFVARE